MLRVLATVALALAGGCSADPPGPHVTLAAVNDAAARFTSDDPALESLFRNALVQTCLYSTATSDGTVYVKTGDIAAEWLRDSSAQAWPYLVFVPHDVEVARFIRGVIERQARAIVVDPYANAFTWQYGVWERKFEVDSLLYPITLAWADWRLQGDTSLFSPSLRAAFASILRTLETEQDHAQRSSYRHGELSDGGRGAPVAVTGMIWSGFRPSDDACTYPYNIADQWMAVTALGELAELEEVGFGDGAAAARARTLASAVNAGIERYGIVTTDAGERIYAYEVDGLGHVLLADDANQPSLLSLPRFHPAALADPIYWQTRAFVLSPHNPFYYAGGRARGVGSPHTPRAFVWPLALLGQMSTAATPSERSDVLAEVVASDPGDHLLHESFDVDNPGRYTRQAFGWPNALFAELLLVERMGFSPLPAGL